MRWNLVDGGISCQRATVDEAARPEMLTASSAVAGFGRGKIVGAAGAAVDTGANIESSPGEDAEAPRALVTTTPPLASVATIEAISR
jgi:hypothetical protein